MDPKMIEMNNLRVLNDYLNQTLEVLTRSPRAAHTTPVGYSPFTPFPGGISAGTDSVWNQGPWSFSGAPIFGTPAQPQIAPSPFNGLPGGGAAYDPFYAQRGFAQSHYGNFGWSQPWGQSWSPAYEVQRQAQVNQTLAAKQSVLEALCRAAGIPV